MKLDSPNQKGRVGVMKTSQHGESRKCKMQKLLEKERWYAEDVEENMHGPVHHIYRKLFCQLESRVYRQLPANDSY
jgi:hypothetical protein